MRRSLLPGIRYPWRAPESNHLLTVRGATLQILATSPVVRTSFTLVVLVVLIRILSRGGRAIGAECRLILLISTCGVRALESVRKECRPRPNSGAGIVTGRQRGPMRRTRVFSLTAPLSAPPIGAAGASALAACRSGRP